MRITIAVFVVMAAFTLVMMSPVFDGVLPFSLSLPQVVADPVVEAAPEVVTPAATVSSTPVTSSIQSQTAVQGMTEAKMYGGGCSLGGY